MATSRANDLANLMSSTTVGSNDLVIDSDLTVDGKVGIGTSSPEAQLDVKNGTTYSSSGDFIARIQQNTNQTGKNGLSVMNAWATDSSIIFEAAMGWNGSQTGYYPVFTIDGSGQAIFRNAAQTERMRIDNTGKVGIGTDAPATELHVNGTISDAIGDVRRPDVNTTSSTTVTPSGSAVLYLSNAATTTVNLNNSNLAAGDIHTVYNNTGSAVTITFTGFTVVREDGSTTNIVADTVTLATGSLLTATAMTSLLLILSSANLTVT